MSTVLSLAVGICFAWSVILFFSAVFMREREQEGGFGWALAGAGLFLIVFADRLPGQPMELREVLTVLPWVSDGSQLFASSLFALLVLFAVYVFRLAVFYQLFLRDPEGVAEDSNEDRANDRVAPPLSYFCFAICVVSLLQPLYGLEPIATTLVCLGLVAGYYWGILPRLLRSLWDLGRILKAVAVPVRRAIRRLVLRGVVLISLAEEYRRGEAASGLGNWVKEFEKKLREQEARVRAADDDLIAKAAHGK